MFDGRGMDGETLRLQVVDSHCSPQLPLPEYKQRKKVSPVTHCHRGDSRQLQMRGREEQKQAMHAAGSLPLRQGPVFSSAFERFQLFQ